MKYLDEYRDAAIVRGLGERIRRQATRTWTLMEVCGGQTHTIVKQGLDELVGGAVEMIHGPGCPVCVTPLEQIDKAMRLAQDPGVIFTSFGDMLRVPGSECDLQQVRARGGQVRVVYSPLDALELAIRNPAKHVVFFAVGFETTAPANAMAVWRARQLGVRNFSVLVSHVTVPPAMRAILDAPDNRVQGFLAAGHVCTVMGWTEYEPIAAQYHVPIVVTGFESADIMEGILLAVTQLEEGRAEVENQYVRSVRRQGTVPARTLVEEVFELVDRKWRGIGAIPRSGLGLRPEYADFDAEYRFSLQDVKVDEPAECHAGEVLRGQLKPFECPAFGTLCTPERPLGAPMVSSEGACAAYFNYRKIEATGHWPQAGGESKEQRPKTKDQRPKTEDQRPKTEDQRPKTEDQRPKTEEQRPKTEEQRPKTEEQRPKTKDQRPKTKEQRPKTKDQRPKTKDHTAESRVTSQEPRVGNRP